MFRNVGTTAQTSLVADRNSDGSPAHCPQPSARLRKLRYILQSEITFNTSPQPDSQSEAVDCCVQQRERSLSCIADPAQLKFVKCCS